MPLNLSVTPGANFNDNSPVTADDLNAAASPLVTIEDNSLDAELLNLGSLLGAIGGALDAQNFLPGGAFRSELMMAASVTCAAGYLTYPVPDWWVRPTGAEYAATFVPKSSTTAAAVEFRPGLKLSANATGTTKLEAGVKLPPHLTQRLATGSVTVSVWVRNQTGTAFVPILRVKTPATPGDDSTMTTRATVSGTSCADGVWTQQKFTFDPVSPGWLTNWNEGAYLIIEITNSPGTIVAGEFVVLADPQLENAADYTALVPMPLVPAALPPGTMFPYGGLSAPPGWLLCDGTDYAVAQYPALAAALSSATAGVYHYGTSGSNFHVPDLRGGVPVGREVAGASQGRLQVTVSAVSSSGDTITTAYGATAALRPGMGVYGHADLPPDATILALTATTIQLSAATTGSVSGALRCSKLGAKDAQDIGSAGNGVSGGARRMKWLVPNCSLSGTTLTFPDAGIMVHADWLTSGLIVSGTGIPAGTKANAYLSTTTMRLSASVTTGSNLTLEFSVDAPEGDEWLEWERLKGQRVIGNLTWPADSSGNILLTLPTDLAYVVCKYGDQITGGTITAGTYIIYLAGVGIGSTGCYINQNLPASAGTTDLTFTRAGTARATAQTPPAPSMQTVHWIIKT